MFAASLARNVCPLLHLTSHPSLSSALQRSGYSRTRLQILSMSGTRRTTRVESLRTSAITMQAAVEGEPGLNGRPRKRVKVEEAYAEAVKEMMDDDFAVDEVPKKTRKRKASKAETRLVADDGETSSRAKKPRTKAAPKALEYDASTFLPRAKSEWKVGAHVSASGGVENAVVNAAMIGANAFALFLKSQRKWTSPALTASSAELFKARMQELEYDTKHVLPHGSYLINLGNPDPEKRRKSYECFVDDLRRCEALGLEYYNFHPGSSVGHPRAESIAHIAECLNEAHREVGGVVTVLENMAGAGNVIGSTFEDIAAIIERVEDKERVGVCFDTCHAYAAGYDISTPEGWEKTMKDFDDIIGTKYLCGMHLNDSKTPCGSKQDRHESIGLGTLGLPAFRSILTDPRTRDIPLILETPSFEKPVEVWGVEVGVLNALSVMGLESHVPSKDEVISPLTETKEVKGGDGLPESKEVKTMDELVEEIRCAVARASLEADAKKAKAKARAVASGKVGKRKRRAKADGQEGADEEDDGEEEEDV